MNVRFTLFWIVWIQLYLARQDGLRKLPSSVDRISIYRIAERKSFYSAVFLSLEREQRIVFVSEK